MRPVPVPGVRVAPGRRRGPPSRSPSVLLVGHEGMDNLGVRSILAVLRQGDIDAGLVPFSAGSAREVVQEAVRRGPALIGFSILFQSALDEYAGLAAALRTAGVRAHFTAGGHYPTLNPRELLRAIPELDSVVRFEGERTLLDLLGALHEPARWGRIPGLAFRRGSRVVLTRPRPLIEDLDSLPWPARDQPRLLTEGVPMAPLLASRGCLYDCAFCSIQAFYRGAPGARRRSRSPASVVAEMRDLHERQGVRLFVFEDDDFAARSPAQRRWIEDFLEALEGRGLRGKVAWMAACRVDEVDPALLRRCQEHGLITLFLGVESGNDAGLRTLGKRFTVKENLRAIKTLKDLNLYFDMGFMLLDPESTLPSVSENLHFLRMVLSDGATGLRLSKTWPLAGTAIERRLRREGRLMGTAAHPDYRFRDPRLDLFAAFAFHAFHGDGADAAALQDHLWLARHDQMTRRALWPGLALGDYGRQVTELTARANAAVLDTLDTALAFVSARSKHEALAEWGLLAVPLALLTYAVRGVHLDLERALRRHSPGLLGQISRPDG